MTHVKLSTRKIRRYLLSRHALAVGASLIFGFTGYLILHFSNAATTSVATEAENGSITSPASSVASAGASAGKALRFSTPTPTPTPTTPPSTTYKAPANPNIIQPARNVYYYLQYMEGRGILAGQQEEDQCTKCESDRMKSITGKYPAVHGHELAAYATNPAQEAINDWNVRNQLVTFTWHVSAPNTSDDWTNVNIDADVNAAVTPGTSQYNSLVSKLDKMAGRLQTVEDANVPVLWRPWHEMDGDWFWWSTSGPEAYKKLWIFSYNYLTNTKGLNNLLWVWSDSESGPPNASWYPGDQYVDIMGSDTYSSRTTISNLKTHYQTHKQIAPNKPVAHSETDVILSPDQLDSQNINFVWFLPWYGQWVNLNSNSYLTQVYNHSYVITADEMPNLKTTFP